MSRIIDAINETMLGMLEAQIESIRTELVDVLGELHVINSKASMINRWIDDPNLNAPLRASEIMECRLTCHHKIVESLNGLKDVISHLEHMRGTMNNDEQD